MAFADDLVLLGDLAVGHTIAFLRKCDMALNKAKCHMLLLFGHRGKTVFNAGATVNINDQRALALTRGRFQV